MAFNTGDMHREAIEYVYVRAAALDLAGQPAAWIALHPLSHDSDFAASLQRIGASSRIIAPALAPWSILATADAAVINSDDAHGDDLRRWAEASGAPVMAMHNTLENDPRRQRFESSRAAFAALRRPSRAPEPPTTTDTTFDDFLASLLRDAAAAAPIQS